MARVVRESNPEPEQEWDPGQWLKDNGLDDDFGNQGHWEKYGPRANRPGIQED